MEKASANKDISILFDFDGTIGDTESPAMEVAFWELAPYLINTRESYSLLVAVSSGDSCVSAVGRVPFHGLSLRTQRCPGGDALLLQ